jgi:hypothetical protein
LFKVGSNWVVEILRNLTTASPRVMERIVMSCHVNVSPDASEKKRGTRP